MDSDVIPVVIFLYRILARKPNRWAYKIASRCHNGDEKRVYGAK